MVAKASGTPLAVEVYPTSIHQSQTLEAVLGRVRIPQRGRKPRKRIRVGDRNGPGDFAGAGLCSAHALRSAWLPGSGPGLLPRSARTENLVTEPRGRRACSC